MYLRKLILPVVAIVLSLCLTVVFTAGYVRYSIDQNNKNIAVAEQQAVATAIQKNNQMLCSVIVTVNESTKGASDVNHKSNSYSIRLQQDFEKLDKGYKCGK